MHTSILLYKHLGVDWHAMWEIYTKLCERWFAKMVRDFFHSHLQGYESSRYPRFSPARVMLHLFKCRHSMYRAVVFHRGFKFL